MSSNRPHDNDPLAPHRGRLLGLAYRMLGSRSDAEDVVQDAYLRFAGAQDVHNPEAFLVTIVTRLCLDRLKSARNAGIARSALNPTWMVSGEMARSMRDMSGCSLRK